MRKCVETKLVTDARGIQVQRCARQEEVDGNDTDILARSTDGQKFGALNIQRGVMRGIGALAAVKAPDILPPLIGGTGTIVALLLIRKFGSKDPASKVRRFAPLIAIVPGIAASLPLNWWGRGGSKAVVSGAVTAAALGLGIFFLETEKAKAWMSTSGMGKLAMGRKQMPKQLTGLQMRTAPVAALPPLRTSQIPASRSPIGKVR